MVNCYTHYSLCGGSYIHIQGNSRFYIIYVCVVVSLQREKRQYQVQSHLVEDLLYKGRNLA